MAALFLACLGFTIGLAAVAFALITRPARRPR
jgi:peptidoglycan/LPS O-acetylase OafA/YrhL